MTGTWLIQQRGRERFASDDELRRMARGGTLDPGDLVYHPFLGRWLYAREVEEVGVELDGARALGRRRAPDVLCGEAYNDAAVAGFTLGVLAIVPVFGIACALAGLPLSLRGIGRARRLGGTDRRFAVVGLVLALASLVVNGGATLLAWLG